MWKQIVDYFIKVFSVTREVDELSKDSEAHEKDIRALQARNEKSHASGAKSSDTLRTRPGCSGAGAEVIENGIGP